MCLCTHTHTLCILTMCLNDGNKFSHVLRNGSKNVMRLKRRMREGGENVWHHVEESCMNPWIFLLYIYKFLYEQQIYGAFTLSYLATNSDTASAAKDSIKKIIIG